jgi:hypothetical protein
MLIYDANIRRGSHVAHSEVVGSIVKFDNIRLHLNFQMTVICGPRAVGGRNCTR